MSENNIIETIKKVFSENADSNLFYNLIEVLDNEDVEKDILLKKLEKEELYKNRKELSKFFFEYFGNIMLLNKEQLTEVFFLANLVYNEIETLLNIKEKKYLYKKGTIIFNSKTKNSFISREELELEFAKDNQYLYLYYDYLFVKYFHSILNSLLSAIKGIMFSKN